ncbi:MAG: SMC family ATPase [Euryarchaeota archaeon]|nr:SMC family ATPase [Euryarchaeota archaeon]
MRAADRIRTGEEEVVAVPAPVAPPEPAEGFVIEEVEMYRFMRYLDRTPPIRFPGQFTVITGKTGSGKTTILDAITFALYKRTTRTDPPANAKITDICQPGGHVRVAFRQRGKRYEVRRGFATGGQPYLELAENGHTIPGTIPEKERAILDVVGLDYEGFLNSTFVRQEEMKALGAASGSERLAVFQKLFRLETFEKAAKLASERLAAVELDARAKEQEVLMRKERLARMPALRAQLAALDDAIAEARTREAEFAAKLTEAREEVRGLEATHDEYTRAESTAREKLATLQQLEARITRLKAEGEDALKFRDHISKLEAETNDFETLQEEGERLRDLQQRHTILVQQREGLAQQWESLQTEHDRRLKQLSDSLFAEERRLAGLTTDVPGDEAFALLRTEGALGERVARIERELEWLAKRADLVATLRQEQLAAKADLEHVASRASRITVESFVLSEIERHVADIKRQIKEEDEAHEAQLAKMREEFQVLDRKIHDLGFAEDAKQRLADIREVIGSLEQKRKELDRLRKDIDARGDPTARLRDLDEDRKRLAADLEVLTGTLESLQGAEAAYGEAKAAHEALARQAEELRKSLYTKEGERRGLAALLTETEAEEAKLDAAAAALADLLAQRDVLAILKNEVFHKKGVVMYAINQLLPELEIEAGKNLYDLTDGRFSRVKLETYEEAKGHGIRILVGGVDGEWHDVGEFSGGEKTQINAALRFAIAKELASMPQVGRTYGRMKTLFLDEADLGSLDTEVSRDLFVAKLFDMGAFFDKVILITHLSEVADRFPARIRVEMTPDQVSRAEVLA